MNGYYFAGTEEKELMSWKNRMKVAIGAAKGLRYLHEDCRVGCIVHRDFRPNNILLTHDFEPMVSLFSNYKCLIPEAFTIFPAGSILEASSITDGFATYIGGRFWAGKMASRWPVS